MLVLADMQKWLVAEMSGFHLERQMWSSLAVGRSSGSVAQQFSIILYTSVGVPGTRFAWIFAWLHNYLNTLKVFGYTINDFDVVILVYLVNIYIYKAISVIKLTTFFIFLA